jgi:hypothetical protein
MNSRCYQFLPEWAGDDARVVQVVIVVLLVLLFNLPLRGRRQPS